MALRPAIHEFAVSFTVDGIDYSVSAWTDMTALQVVRDVARHPGTRWRCEAGICGSCEALLNDVPTRLCSVGSKRLVGARIELPSARSPAP